MIKVTTRVLAGAGAIAAATALVSAGTAWADQSLNGTYAMKGGSDDFSATVRSNCANPGCTASVISNRGWTSVATLTGNRWNFNVVKPDGVICPDGNYADVVIRYSVDASTLSGTVVADSNGECPGGEVTEFPMQLTKIG